MNSGSMWGNLEGARELESGDELSLLLFEISGPLCIEVESVKWQELLMHYDRLVHLDPESNSVVSTVCEAMARNAVSSLNLSALTIHVCRMVLDVSEESNEELEDKTKQIYLEGKARATCGAMNLLRILIHSVIESCSDAPDALEMIFENKGSDLIDAVIKLITVKDPPDVLYDVTVLGLELLLVLLSTQLYSNHQELNHIFLSCFMSKSTPVLEIVQQILNWFIYRPKPPSQSLAAHHTHLLHTILSSQFRPASDGFYDRSDIVQAFLPSNSMQHQTHDEMIDQIPPQSILLDATRGVIKVSSKILMLPFRILFLALFLLSPSHSSNLQLTGVNSQKFLWISDSPLCDLGVSLLLLLTQNYRKEPYKNYYRDLLASLADNRYEMNQNNCSINFESLFQAFAGTIHNELGALLFYTFMQTCPNFAAFISVRFDLDHLVLPLLRTLYISSSISHLDTTEHDDPPFRSQSQLYLILILLLIFSQHPSFGADAYRRITLNHLPWYKERYLKDISLGSLLLLVLLRTLVFNLQKLNDDFLVSNTSAVLVNLSPYMSHLHSYASMRLVMVTIAMLKRLVAYSTTNNNNQSPLLPMCTEACRSLLHIIQQCMRPDVIETNLDLLYALVYSQVDIKQTFISTNKVLLQFKQSTKTILSLIEYTDSIIRKGNGNASQEMPLSAIQAMAILQRSSGKVKQYSYELQQNYNIDADETFIYEEDTDPEIFFVPYVWEVVVKVVTSSFLEWKYDSITLFKIDLHQNQDIQGTLAQDVTNVV